MPATYALNNVALNWLRNVDTPKPTTLYLAALTAAASDKVPTVTEVAQGNYARQAFTLGAPANGVSTNNANINFPVATVAYLAPVTHVGIYDAAAAGTCYWVLPLSAAKTIGIGDQLSFDMASYNLTLTAN